MARIRYLFFYIQKKRHFHFQVLHTLRRSNMIKFAKGFDTYIFTKQFFKYGGTIEWFKLQFTPLIFWI